MNKYIMCTVSEIAAMFHDFKTFDDPLNTCKRNGKKTGRALLLATVSVSHGKLQCQIGNESEQRMLNAYEEKMGRSITRRNDTLYEMTIGGFRITGKVDGIVEKEGIVIEHKRRIRGLLNRVPYHELVQCFLYMKLTGLNMAHLVETFGMSMQIHEIQMCVEKWKQMENLIIVNIQ